jgi:hypothetical protein
MKTKTDYFRINTEETIKEQFNLLIENLKIYSNKINVYENDLFLYFSIENILNFRDYFKFICDYAYYNDCENIDYKLFYSLVSNYDLRNDLI